MDGKTQRVPRKKSNTTKNLINTNQRVELLFRNDHDHIYQLFLIYEGPKSSLPQKERQKIIRHLMVTFGPQFKRRGRKKMSEYAKLLSESVDRHVYVRRFVDDDEVECYENYHVVHLGVIVRGDQNCPATFVHMVKKLVKKDKIVDVCTVGNIP